MLPLQLLVQNLLYDLSQTTIPFDPVDAEDLAKPRKWEALGIARFMLFLGPISSVFDLATFALLWWIFGAYSPQKQSLFQSGWFVEGLLSQTLIGHMIRSPPRALFPELALYATCVDYDRHCYNRGNSAVYGNWFSNRFSTAAD